MNQNSRSIVLCTGLSHAIVHAYELSIPLLVTVWLVEFPVSTAALGAAVSIGYALFGIGALPGGVLADRFGSRTLIIACLAGMGLSFLLLSVANGLLAIGIALGAWGIAASVYHPSGLALISTGVEERGSAFAYHGMAGNVGIAVGPLLTALLLLTFEWRTVAQLLVLPTVVAIGYALTTEFDETAAVSVDSGTNERIDDNNIDDDPDDSIDDSRGNDGIDDHTDGGVDDATDDSTDDATTDRTDDTESMSLSAFVRDSRALFTVGFGLAMAIVMMNGLFYRGMLTFLPEVLDGFLPPASAFIGLFEPGSPLAEEFTLASYVYVGLLTVGIGGQYVGGKLSDRIASTTGLAVVFAGLVAVSVAFVPAARGGVAALLVVSGLLGFLLFALQPLYQATIADNSPPGDRGLSYGYTYLTSFGIGAAGAAISGFLLSVATADGTFLALAVFPALGSLLAVVLQRREDRTGGGSAKGPDTSKAA